MDSHSEADAPRLTQIQKVNACLHSLIQKVSLLFLISRLQGGGFWSHADLASSMSTGKADSCTVRDQEGMSRQENLWQQWVN